MISLHEDGAPAISHHAAARIRQRGIRTGALDLVLRLGDRDRPVGGGCTAVSISRRRLGALRAGGWPPHLLDQAKRLTVVEADDGAVVTVLHRRGRAGRRYWRA